MYTSGTRNPFSMFCTTQSKTLDLYGVCGLLQIRPAAVSGKLSSLRFASFNKGVTMRDRSKNRKPLQRGRNLSIEALQTVQALKRAKKDGNELERVFASNVKRLLKLDIVAVLRELLRQNEGVLALKVFEEIRKEYWYKPQVLLYADMIAVLASNGLFEKMELLFLYLKMENSLEANTEAFNALLTALMEFSIIGLAVEAFYIMKAVGCEPDKSTFRIMINGLELKGETDLSTELRQGAKKIFGESLDFLEEESCEIELQMIHNHKMQNEDAVS